MKSFQPKVAVVILNYNTRPLLERFLPDVLNTQYSNTEVWVVDNASTDDSVEYMKQHFSEVKLLVSEKNLGYAGGYNWALNQIKAEYYVLLNSDVSVTPTWLDPLVEMALRSNDIAAIQPKILDAKSTEQFEYAGASGGFLDKWGYPFCRGRIFESLEKDNGQYNDELEVFWASGACLFVRSVEFHNVGGFDSDFFAHMEEIDLCWRLQLRGKKIMVQPNSEVFHIGGGTLSEGSEMKYFLNFRNNLILLVKNEESTFWTVKVFWRLILDGLSAIKFVLDGKPKLVITVIKAHFAFFGSLRTSINKRKIVQGKASTRVSLYPKSIVWQHFVKKVNRFTDL